MCGLCVVSKSECAVHNFTCCFRCGLEYLVLHVVLHTVYMCFLNLDLQY